MDLRNEIASLMLSLANDAEAVAELVLLVDDHTTNDDALAVLGRFRELGELIEKCADALPDIVSLPSCTLLVGQVWTAHTMVEFYIDRKQFSFRAEAVIRLCEGMQRAARSLDKHQLLCEIRDLPQLPLRQVTLDEKRAALGGRQRLTNAERDSRNVLIREALDNGMSQAEAATAFNLSVGHISKLANGHH